MISLLEPYKHLVRKISVLQGRAQAILASGTEIEEWCVRYATESLVQDTYTIWTQFVRSVILQSCAGTKLRNGTAIPARTGNNSWARVGYEARQATKRANIKPTGGIKSIRQEPNWGDPDKAIDIVKVLNPTNNAQLISAFGLPLRGIRDLRVVRNALAHKNSENLDVVNKLSVYYLVHSRIDQPASLAWIREAHSRRPGINVWLDDLQLVANVATK